MGGIYLFFMVLQIHFSNVERMDGAYGVSFGGAVSRRSMPRFVVCRARPVISRVRK